MTLIIALIALGLIGGLLLYLFTDPILPTGSEKAIKETTSKELPELITGTTGYASSGSVKIWYERRNQTAKGTVLLISGLTIPATFWHQKFIQSIADLGYEIVRFDNRSVGLSDWMKNWSGDSPYSTTDMVNDAIAVLDHNQVDRAHIIGLSLGGYIGQRIAIEHPERVLSLTSLSSTADLNGNHPTDNWAIPMPVTKLFLRLMIVKSDRNYLKCLFKFFDHVNGRESKPIELILLGERGLYEIHRRNGFNPSARKHQMTAMRNSRPTYDRLSEIKVPTLVAHGENDPIISFDLARKYASQIRDSSQVWVDGTGHAMTDYYISRIMPDLAKVLEKGTLV